MEISLFVPCLVDQCFPEIGLSMVRVLRRLGCKVSYNPEQTCCGQPAFNSGHWPQARTVAGTFLRSFKDSKTIVCPSGSCVSMVRNFYSRLFEDEEIKGVSERIFEFSEFVVSKQLLPRVRGGSTYRVGIHNSCHSLRELHLTDQSERIVRCIEGAELVSASLGDSCCGFGGLFCFKFREVATAMATARLETFLNADPDIIVSNDPGCIMHLRQYINDRPTR